MIYTVHVNYETKDVGKHSKILGIIKQSTEPLKLWLLSVNTFYLITQLACFCELMCL